VESGLAGTGDVDFVAPQANWPTLEKVFREWTKEQGLGPVLVCRHLPDTMFLVAVDRTRSCFLQLDVRSRLTFRGSTLCLPGDLEGVFELDKGGFRRLRPGAEGLLKLVVSGIAPGGRPKRKTLARERVSELLSVDPDGVRIAAELCGPARRAALSGAMATINGKWSRPSMALVEAWFLAKGVAEPRTFLGRVRARRAKAKCPLIQTSITHSRRIPVDVDEWLARIEADHSVLDRHSRGGGRR